MKELQNDANFFTQIFYIRIAFPPLQIRSFDEVKIFKYMYCTKKGSTKVFFQYSETARTDAKSKMERFVLIINVWKQLTIVKKSLQSNNPEIEFQTDGA